MTQDPKDPAGAAVDVRSVVEEIEQTVRRKREEGAYPPEISAEIDDISGGSFSIERLERSVMQLRQAIAFSPVVSTESSKPYVGPAISGVKRGVMRMTQWYIAGILDQVRIFSEMVLRSSKLVVDHVARLESRIAVLEEELERLEQVPRA